MMVEDGTLARRDGRWELVRALASSLPDTVQGVIASRIDLLLPEEKRAVQDASVVGRVFWAGAVARLGGAGAGAALEGLLAKGLVLERDASTVAGERELIFNHILTRDVAYSSIPRARRADAHASSANGWSRRRPAATRSSPRSSRTTSSAPATASAPPATPCSPATDTFACSPRSRRSSGTTARSVRPRRPTPHGGRGSGSRAAGPSS